MDRMTDSDGALRTSETLPVLDVHNCHIERLQRMGRAATVPQSGRSPARNSRERFVPEESLGSTDASNLGHEVAGHDGRQGFIGIPLKQPITRAGRSALG